MPENGGGGIRTRGHLRITGFQDQHHDNATSKATKKLQQQPATVPHPVPHSNSETPRDPDLTRLHAAWPTLPDPIKTAILALLDVDGTAVKIVLACQYVVDNRRWETTMPIKKPPCPQDRTVAVR